jgi:hypothetical protein
MLRHKSTVKGLMLTVPVLGIISACGNATDPDLTCYRVKGPESGVIRQKPSIMNSESDSTISPGTLVYGTGDIETTSVNEKQITMLGVKLNEGSPAGWMAENKLETIECP